MAIEGVMLRVSSLSSYYVYIHNKTSYLASLTILRGRKPMNSFMGGMLFYSLSLIYINICDIIINMKVIKTAKCKLEVDNETKAILIETIKRFTDCCNDILEIAKEHKTSNRYELQRLCYHQLKAKYNLPANLVIRAIARVSDSIRVGKYPRKFNPTSISYDLRTFCYIPPKEEISISTHAGRKHIKLRLGNFQRGLLAGQKPKSAILLYNRNKKVFYINIVLEKEVVVPSGSNPIGVDMGLYNTATTSKGQRFSGKQTMHTRKHYSKLRQRLQAKGTKSAKRRLKQLSGKERRWMTDKDHCISKAIVNNCERGDVIVIEDLKYIRERVKVQKKQKLFIHSWSFYQLQSFIAYKAIDGGIPVVLIDPRYTSQTCSRCGQLGNRSGHVFACPSCSHKNNADFNASYNIQRAGLAFLDGLQSISPDVANVDVKAPSDNASVN